MSFTHELATLSQGSIDQQLTEHLAALVQAVQDTGKKGSLSIKITVAQFGKGNERVIKLQPAISLLKPKHDLPESIRYASDSGLLTVNDPDQVEMKLQTVDTETGELKSIKG